MVYRFISKWTSHDIPGIGKLSNSYPFSTEDEGVAERLRSNKDVFEIKAGVFEKIEEDKKEADSENAELTKENPDGEIQPHEVAMSKIKKPKKGIQGMRTASEVKREGE